MSKHRSPNYPAMGLSEAVEKVGVLFEKEKRTVIDPAIAVVALGYRSLHGPARSALSALKKYGLVEESGKGVRVSDLTIRVLHPADEQERMGALREAALRVDLFREISDSMPDGSDDAVASFLIKRGFSAGAARQAIDAYRDTTALAKLRASGYTPTQDEREPEAMTTGTGTTSRVSESTAQRTSQRTYSWALSKDVSAELRLFGEPLTQAQADRLRQYVDLTVKAILDGEEGP